MKRSTSCQYRSYQNIRWRSQAACRHFKRNNIDICQRLVALETHGLPRSSAMFAMISLSSFINSIYRAAFLFTLNMAEEFARCKLPSTTGNALRWSKYLCILPKQMVMKQKLKHFCPEKCLTYGALWNSWLQL